jgi:CRISPR-associated endonuclease/helicase Cas3
MKAQAHENQSVEGHLIGVAKIATKSASKFKASYCGYALGLLHDRGKYSEKWQEGFLKRIADKKDINLSDSKESNLPDHSTSGARFIWHKFLEKYQESKDPMDIVCGQILALIVASHHTGLSDFIGYDKINGYGNDRCELVFENRMDHNVREIEPVTDTDIDYSEIDLDKIKEEITYFYKQHKNKYKKQQQLVFSLFIRMLYSCLIDADRIDSACYDQTDGKKLSLYQNKADWGTAQTLLNDYVAALPQKSSQKVNELRKEVYRQCVEKARSPQGIFSLTVPTGGAKTLSSIAFAIAHAITHNLDRIFIIIPFTSIIDQNAETIRNILGDMVIEHHSNLTDNENTYQTRIMTENWSGTIIFTTQVQFFNALFDKATKAARRAHNLAKSVIIFDEAQTIPLKTFHLFNNYANELVEYYGCTIVLCTATQLPFEAKTHPVWGALFNPIEIMKNKEQLYLDLDRVTVKFVGKKLNKEIAGIAINKLDISGNCLVIANTKGVVFDIYNNIKQIRKDCKVYHLSTNMCPQHRLDILKRINEDLVDRKNVICVSTQLIEAGVDIDFNSVVRCLAGLDSIAQAAGRCNRNGLRSKEDSEVIVVEAIEENVQILRTINRGKEKTSTIIARYGSEDLLSLQNIKRYFKYYLDAMEKIKPYPLDMETPGNENLIDILSDNRIVKEALDHRNKKTILQLKQSLGYVGSKFSIIDMKTIPVICPRNEECKSLLEKIKKCEDDKELFRIMKRLQKYIVNIFDKDITRLSGDGKIEKIKEFDIYYLSDMNLYDEDTGFDVKQNRYEESWEEP